MTPHEPGFAVLKEWLGIAKKLPGHVFGRWNHFCKGTIIFVEEFVIETVVQNRADTLLDLADVHQHAGGSIDFTGENEVSYVVPTCAVTRRRFRPERREVFRLAPLAHEQTS